MTTTVSSNSPLTDYSGYLKAGMSTADLEQYKESPLFKDIENGFKKADVDNNGILSEDEIISDLNRDLKNLKRGKTRHAVLAGVTFGIALATVASGGLVPLVFGALGVLNTVCAVNKLADQAAIEQILKEER